MVILTVLASMGALIRFCGIAFACGCTWPWDGGAASCDIHTPGPPDCPWCVHGAIAGAFSAVGIGSTQLILSFLTLKLTGRALPACLVGVLTLLPAGIVFVWLTRLLGL